MPAGREKYTADDYRLDGTTDLEAWPHYELVEMNVDFGVASEREKTIIDWEHDELTDEMAYRSLLLLNLQSSADSSDGTRLYMANTLVNFQTRLDPEAVAKIDEHTFRFS